MKTTLKEKISGVVLPVTFDGEPKDTPDLYAYLFDVRGQLKEEKPVSDGKVELRTDSREIRGSRLFIAPIAPKDGSYSKPDIESMIRRSAYEPMLRVGRIGQFEILPIPELHWKFWCWQSCRVHGKVMKPVLVNGSWVDRPVCGARVHICEVDKLMLVLPTIPDDIIFRLRDEILRIPERPIGPVDPPEYIPRPIPRPVPGPVPPGPYQAVNAGRITENGGIAASAGADFRHTAIKDQYESTMRAMPTMAAPIQPRKQTISAEVYAAMSSNTADGIRAALTTHFTILYPWICLWQWTWPWLYRCDELRVVDTDELGRFDTTIFYQCFTDKPDLYFWVEYMVGEQYETVYHPHVACYTYWDFDCDSEVKIRIYDSRVEACGDVPELTGVRVEVRKIGSGGIVSRIAQGETTAPLIQGIPFNRQGTITGIDDTSGFPQPFGGTLAPQVIFGSQLIDAGVTHYRWSYRQREDENGVAVSDGWKVLDSPVYRRYREEAVIGNVIKSYPLGPDPSYSVTAYKIPRNFAHELEQTDVPELGSVPNPDGMFRSWVSEEFGTASLNTLFTGTDLASRLSDAGLYELKFELMKITAGAPTVVSLSKDDWLMPDPANPSLSPEIPDLQKPTYLVDDPGDSSKATGFKFVLRVDNNPCGASIEDVFVEGETSDPECGFVDYADKANSDATLAFTAAHPNGFARFGFTVNKGNSNNVPAATDSGMVIGDTTDYNLEADGKFRAAIPVNTLLGACDQAAFAELLHVRALATNGSVRLSSLDRGVLAAFALEPEAV